MGPSEAEQLYKRLERYKEYPVEFCLDVFGVELDKWQKQAMKAMATNQKVAIGVANTFFAVVTPGATSNLFSSLLAFRPGDAIGVFSWVMGTSGCPPTEDPSAIGCAFVDDWAPSGFFGPPFHADVTQIVVWRSSMGYNGLVS